MGIYCGIDLGTTNSTVSIILDDGFGDDPIELVQTLPIYQLDEMKNILKDKISLPSSIYFDLDNENVYTGVYAKNEYGRGNKPMQTIRSVKTRIGGESLVEIPHEKDKSKKEYFDMIECSAILLKTIKKSVELQYPDEDILGAVVTVPAAFNIDERQATRNAMLLAGFDEIHILDEPTAALLYYVNDYKNKADGNDLDSKDSYKLVYDIGGGTTDVSIAKMNLDDDDNLDLKIVGRSPRMDFGGDDFDQYLASYLLSRFEQGEPDIHLMSEEDQNRMIARMVFNAEKEKIVINEKIKKVLGNESRLKRLKIHSSFEVINGKYIHNIELNKDTINSIYDDLISSEEAKVLQAIKSALADANLDKSVIGEIILTGGMSNFYVVEETLRKYFGDSVRFILIDTESSVSKGAVIHHYQQEYDEGIKLRLEDKLSDDIFIKQGRDFKLIIPRSVVPGTCGEYEYEIMDDSLVKIEVFLYYGRGENPEHYTPIEGKFAYLDSPKKKGDKIKINWELNEDKIINIHIEELNQRIEINSSKEYTHEEVRNSKIQKLNLNGGEI
ncbi:MAG: Hsp70 family protein [Peptostreptococcaceae bacterium]